MSGKFNPFQSRESEVLREQTVTSRDQARKAFAKVRRKRPCLWSEIPSLSDPAADPILAALTGETCVLLFVTSAPNPRLPNPLPPALDALVSRLWKNFNKLWLIHLVG
jgi:hypothetical protein